MLIGHLGTASLEAHRLTSSYTKNLVILGPELKQESVFEARLQSSGKAELPRHAQAAVATAIRRVTRLDGVARSFAALSGSLKLRTAAVGSGMDG